MFSGFDAIISIFLVVFSLFISYSLFAFILFYFSSFIVISSRAERPTQSKHTAAACLLAAVCE